MANSSKSALAVVSAVILTLGLSLSFQSLLAAWTAPTASPPGGNPNQPVFNVSADPANSVEIAHSTGVAGNLTATGMLTVAGQAVVNTDANSILMGDLIGGDGSRGLVLRAGNTDRLTILTSGNVGIGTALPQGTLDLGSGSSGRSLVWGGDGSGHYASIGTNYSSADLSLVSGLKLNPAADQYLVSNAGAYSHLGMRFDLGNGRIRFFTEQPIARVLNSVFDYAAATKMTITGAGNVGVGINNPTTPLHVFGTQIGSFLGSTRGIFTVSGAYSVGAYSSIDFLYNSTSLPSSRIAEYHDGSGSRLMFGTSNNYGTGITNTALTIGSNGSIGINNTNPSSSYRLNVTGDIHSTAFIRAVSGFCIGASCISNWTDSIPQGTMCGAYWYIRGSVAGDRYCNGVDISGGSCPADYTNHYLAIPDTNGLSYWRTCIKN